MKRILSITACVATVLALASCKQKEEEFVIKGEPYFRAEVYETVTEGGKETDVKLASLEESVQYELAQSADAYSAAANSSNHVRKAVRFKVASNLRWKVVPADGEPCDWVHAFPESGEKDGIFLFKSERNLSPSEERSAYFNVLVDKGAGYEPLEGMITVRQAKSDLFLELSAAKFNVAASAQTVRLYVLANVDWTYQLSPMEDYGTKDVSWITDNTQHVASKQVDTLSLKVAANETGVRGANIVISYAKEGETVTEVVPITQYPATEVELPGFPVKWAVRVTPNTYASTWPSAGTIEPVSGAGIIRYNNAAGKAADVNGKCLFDVSDNCPRVTGPWPGDYCEFIASSPVSAGTIIKLSFATRVSGTGHKYWRLEYRDGDEWRVAGKTRTDESVKGPDGQPVVYTHEMASDGSTNIIVESVVVYENNTDQVEFRFICAANWQANGNGALQAPNGGTWRLAVDSKTADDPYQPMISCVAAGAETLTEANLTVSDNYLVFNGQNPAEKTLKISSDQDVTFAAEQEWIHLDKASADAGEGITLKVTVDESTLSENREGKVIVKAGITRKEIAVIQGAAGQNLDPFISISGGNGYNVKAMAGTLRLTVQANVEVEAEAPDEWLTVEKVGTKAMVDWTEYIVSYEANDQAAGAPRTGTIRFFNTAENLESIALIHQEYEEPAFENNLIQWGFSADLMASYKDHFEKDAYMDANVAGRGTLMWVDLPENIAADTGNKKSHVVGGTGQPYVTGAWPGDYWQFVIPLCNIAPGSEVHFQGLHRVSGTGHKYWRMEWSADGTTWAPVGELKTETETGTSAQYTHEAPTSDVLIDERFVLQQGIAGKGTLYIRFTCAANWQANGKGALAAPNGGTHRWAGAEADGPTITIGEPEVPPEVAPVSFPVVWSFPEPGDNWVDGVDWHCANPSGSYVFSDTHDGKMTVVRPGGEAPMSGDAEQKPTYKKEGNLGVRLLHYGMYKDDYWLFEVDHVKNPAGTYTIGYGCCSSAAGPKFFALEYSVDEGVTWTGINTKTESKSLKDSSGTRDVTYTYAISPQNNKANEVTVVTESFHLAAVEGKLMIRARVSDTMKLDTTADMTSRNHGGTNRIGGEAQILFAAD